MIELIPRILGYNLFRKFNHPQILPVNLTISVTYRCNSKCKTCNIWRKKVNEFTLEEFEKVFLSLSKAPFWFTFSGGEPFLRDDLAEICKSAYLYCHPVIINIPTNGILWRKITDVTEEILESCPKSKIVVNLSLDEIGERHDEIRGSKGCFQKVLKTYKSLRALNYPNLVVGIHTVISKFNVDRISLIYEYMDSLRPDSYVTEIAEERAELDTVGKEITPNLKNYSKAVDFISSQIKNRKFTGLSRITQAFRLEYYQLVKRILKEKRQVIPCYAGFASAQIAPDGDVWFCCIKAEPVGNLRDTNYNFSRIWTSEKANSLRKNIKEGKCSCPMANASYTNMLCDFKKLLKVGSSLFQFRDAAFNYSEKRFK